MKRTNKKGFTIVELVIVIAVIAILAAVLIPNISRLVKKANQSADIQACRQMNMQLAVNEITEGKDILQVYTALAEGGMSAKDYKPLSSDTFYFWDSSLNRVLYTDKDYKVLYPEEYKTAKKDNGWYSLTQEIPEKGYKIADGVVNITEAGQLVKLGAETKGGISSDLTINLENDIDMMGAKFQINANGHNVTLQAEGDTPVTIRGLVNTNYKDLVPNNAGTLTCYGDSIICSDNGTLATVTVKNVTFDGISLGGSESVDVALVVVNGAKNNHTTKTVTMENVHIKNSTFIGKYRIAGFLAHTDGKVSMKDCSIENSTLTASVGAVAPIFSMLTTAPDGTDKFENVTVGDKVVVKCTNTNLQKFDELTLVEKNHPMKLPTDGMMGREDCKNKPAYDGVRWYPLVSSFGMYGYVGENIFKVENEEKITPAKDGSGKYYSLASGGLDCVENITDANNYRFPGN